MGLAPHARELAGEGWAVNPETRSHAYAARGGASRGGGASNERLGSPPRPASCAPTAPTKCGQSTNVDDVVPAAGPWKTRTSEPGEVSA